jgi:C-terminal processing protease CtpA/Prc
MKHFATFLFLIAVSLSATCIAQEKPITDEQRSMALQMLRDVRSEVKGSYYDPSFHGVDLDGRFQKAEAIVQGAKSFNQAMGAIPWALDVLNDSHTFFVPPPRDFRHSYGWRMQMIGDRCFVTAVKPGSPAESKGLKAGDEVLTVDGMKPERKSFWKLGYLLNALRPQPGLHVDLRSPEGTERVLDIPAIARQTKHLGTGLDYMDDVRLSQRWEHFYHRQEYALGSDILVWKLPAFLTNEKGADAMVNEARKYKSLILDLRGNPGGRVDMLSKLAGGLFDHDVKVADIKGRKPEPVQLGKTRGAGSFSGRLIVLVDSQSASAAEVLARLVQLEKRGTVLGDASAGAVMESVFHPMRYGMDRVIFYGVSITRADVIMSDGRSLEQTGVVPDELILPSAIDLASDRDPVLARAVALAGGSSSPEEAGKFFPKQWPPDID